MIPLTTLPMYARVIFRKMPTIFWHNKHMLVICWLILAQATTPGRKTIKELSRWTPSKIAEWNFRRLLNASYWSIHVLIAWCADEVIKSFPPPKDGTVYLVGDGSHKEKRGKKNPAVQKGRKSKYKPWFFGIRFVLLAICWDVYRIPVGFRIILPKSNPKYKKENALFREMVAEFEPPVWAKTVVVMGDSGYASKENMNKIKNRDKSDPQRRWFFVFSIARTWKTEAGKSLKDMVTFIPLKFFSRTWIPPLNKDGRRKCFWVFGKTICLRDVGDVTVVFSKKGRNVGPQKTKIIVTNMPGSTPRQVISIYQRRWPIEIIFKELKSGLGLGEHQVSKVVRRVENSLGIAILAYLFLLLVCKKDIKPNRAWSIFQLQNAFRLRVIKDQICHEMGLKIKKLEKAA